MRRKLRNWAVCAAVCLGVWACSGPAPSGPDSDAAGANRLVMRLAGDPPNLNPLHDAIDAYGMSLVYRHVFETLLEPDNETLELEPYLAESWDESDDHLVYTFHLDPAARFSDGAPVTADDVVFTIETIQNLAHETGNARSQLSRLDRVEAVDPHTVRFHCTQPYFRHPIVFGMLPILPKHVYGEGDFNTHPNNRAPIGSGPYVFEVWETNREIRLARNDTYWRPEAQPAIDKLVYRIVSDDNTAFMALLQRQIDVMILSPEQWDGQASRPEFTAYYDKHITTPGPPFVGSFSFIGWNMRRPPFDDARVRRAMTMLLDRELISETIFYGLYPPLAHPFIPGTPEYHDALPGWPFDPAAAEALLDEAGWRDSNGDGVRDKDGQAFRFEYLIRSNMPEDQQIATVYKEELGRHGIEMTIRSIEWASVIERVMSHDFDGFRMGWAIPTDSDPYGLWHSSLVPQGNNYVGFIHEEADRLVDSARTEFDRAKRVALYHRLQEILHDEQPYTVINEWPTLLAVSKRFEDVRLYPMGPDYREWRVAGSGL